MDTYEQASLLDGLAPARGKKRRDRQAGRTSGAGTGPEQRKHRPSTYVPKEDRRESVAHVTPMLGGSAIDAAFWKFHTANPDVYDALVKFARQAKERGRHRFGAKMLWERLRWYTMFETSDPSGFKLNNNYTSRYARLVMEQERCSSACEGCMRESCLAGLFQTRKLSTPSALEIAAA